MLSCVIAVVVDDVQRKSTMYLINGTLRSAPLPWLPVLVNTEPPTLRCKAAVDRLIEKTAIHEDWPLHKYVSSSSYNCLPSRRPLWTDTRPIDVTSQWLDDWKSASVVNSSLVDVSTIQQPGFDLPR